MAVTALIVGMLAQPASAAEAEMPRGLSVYYFGNSFLENSVPWFHPTLAKSAGERLRVSTAIGPGWQIWMHSTSFERPGSWNHRKEILGGTWDAVLIQHFASPGLNKIRRTCSTAPAAAGSTRRAVSETCRPRRRSSGCWRVPGLTPAPSSIAPGRASPVRVTCEMLA